MDRTTGGMSIETVGEIVFTKAPCHHVTKALIHNCDLLNTAHAVGWLQNLARVCLHHQQTLGPLDHQEL